MARFAAPRTLMTASELTTHASCSLLKEWVVGRDLCHFISVDLAKVPSSKRSQALKHYVESKSPWSEVGFCAVWQGSTAQVWLWNQDVIKQLLKVLPTQSLTRLLPEMVFFAKPDQDGVYLAECARGYDLQYWNKGILLASRWFEHMPSMPDVQWFCRAQGIAAIDTAQLIELPTKIQPWLGARPSALGWLQAQQNTLVIVAALFAVFLFTSQATLGFSWMLHAKQLEAKSQQLQGVVMDVQSLRGEARRQRRDIEQLLPRLYQPDPIAAQQLFMEKMPPELEYEVILWERQGNRVEVVIRAELTEVFALVTALSGQGIENVNVEPWRRADHHRILFQLNTHPQALLNAGVLGAQ
ncbi:hypothetical protein [Nitrincola tapanii]|uniref:Uncharacterized protein n=1 Tax=Nitrincola tapanii TaxID=1708751 RepID=A0A5A9W2G7_9GAMM|nr:hypothetical protein [Nitrincola tapanii]KAA0874399.1 hypothetical protein E1H14_09000 [Nitrincola tapanii]